MAETEYVEILVGVNDQPEIARKLLDAAGDNPEVVRTISAPPGFRVPKSVAESAGYSAAEGDVAAVDARAIEGYAVENVTAGPAEAGARSGEARTADEGEVGLGDREVQADLDRVGERTDRVDNQPPLGERENVTTEGSGTSLTSNRITTTEFSGVEGGGTGLDAAETNPPGTLTESQAPERREVGEGEQPRRADYQGESRTTEQPPAQRPDDADDLTPDQARELKGDALDDALKARGLPHTTGTADEKRQRLADHLRG
jgi:hypothetical protein